MQESYEIDGYLQQVDGDHRENQFLETGEWFHGTSSKKDCGRAI